VANVTGEMAGLNTDVPGLTWLNLIPRPISCAATALCKLTVFSGY